MKRTRKKARVWTCWAVLSEPIGSRPDSIWSSRAFADADAADRRPAKVIRVLITEVPEIQRPARRKARK